MYEARLVVGHGGFDACCCYGPLGGGQAAPIGGKADAQCAKLAIRTLGPSINPSTYTFHGGTEGDDPTTTFTDTEGQPDVFCGFGGDDVIRRLDAGDIFLGGDGNDFAFINNATFNGEEGNDRVENNSPVGTFNGGPGIDTVDFGEPPVDGPSGT